MDPNWSLAHVEEARAYYFADHVLLSLVELHRCGRVRCDRVPIR